MTKQKLITIISIIMLMPAFVISSFAQKKVELKYNMTEGDVYNYTIDTDQDIVIDANGMTMAMDNLVTFVMVQKIIEVTADSIKVEGEISRTKMTQNFMGMSIIYDSDDPSSSQNPMAAKMGEEFSKLINKPFYLVMDHKGNMGAMDISNLSDNDDIAKNLNSGSQYANYPEGKVAVGDSWEKEITPMEGSDMKFKAKYTLLKISGKQATIGIEGTISSNSIQGEDIKMSGTMEGEMIVDIKTGWLIESTMDQDLELDIEQNGMSFPATITGTTTTTSSKQN